MSSFSQLEAAYLDPPNLDCRCDLDPCVCDENDWEPDAEWIAEERAERMEARYES